MTKLIFATLMLVAATLAPAKAGGHPTGYDLYAECVGSNFEQVVCMNLLHAVWDHSGGTICPRGTIQGGQAKMIFIRWAQSHPQSLSMSHVAAALESLKSAFPCQ
jgi:hypothetical protein